MSRFCFGLWMLLFLVVAPPGPCARAIAEENPTTLPKNHADSAREHADSALAAARKFVEASDRYLHHSKLKRGMKGYGLSVFTGTEIARFDVEIISVMRNLRPGQDIILAKLSKQNLEKSMLVSGMSGSPVFVKDPADGKFKMIGAVALRFGFASTEPLCGLQPITQMLGLPGVLPPPKPQPDSKPAKKSEEESPATSPSSKPSPTSGVGPATDTDEFLRIVLDPEKRDFAYLSKPAPPEPIFVAGGKMRPLSTPLSVSGCGPQTLQYLRKIFAPTGMIPVQGGGFTGLDKSELRKVALAPGSCLAIPLVTGDADWSAIGTVTEVIGERVLGFGHGMNGEGDTILPMGTGYIHTIVNDQFGSFKLGAMIRPVGKLNRDENVAVGGVVGQEVRMVPMTLRVDQTEDKRVQTFNYRLLHKRQYTAGLCSALVFNSAGAQRRAPHYNHIRYDVEVDFGELGLYKASNIAGGGSRGMFSSGARGVSEAASDVARPIAALMNNPFGPPPEVKSIDVKLTIHKGNIDAIIIDFKLDAETYRPGQTVTGKVLLERFRKKRITLPVQFTLPSDLPDGRYPLTVGDHYFALKKQQQEQPQEFNPRTVEELFESLKRLVATEADHLYLHLPLPRGGLALGRKKLPDLPSGKADILLQAGIPDTKKFTLSLKQSSKTPYVVHGQKTATVIVRKQTNETLMR